MIVSYGSSRRTRAANRVGRNCCKMKPEIATRRVSFREEYEWGLPLHFFVSAANKGLGEAFL
jgi:hypothetical protein